LFEKHHGRKILAFHGFITHSILDNVITAFISRGLSLPSCLEEQLQMWCINAADSFDTGQVIMLGAEQPELA